MKPKALQQKFRSTHTAVRVNLVEYIARVYTLHCTAADVGKELYSREQYPRAEKGFGECKTC